MTTDEKIAARLIDLRAAEQETQTRLIAIRTAIGELEAAIAPEDNDTPPADDGSAGGVSRGTDQKQVKADSSNAARS